MALDYSFRLLSKAPSHRMVAQWVHQVRLHLDQGRPSGRFEVGDIFNQKVEMLLY